MPTPYVRRRPDTRVRDERTIWLLGIFVGAFVVGFILWSAADRVTQPRSSTTGSHTISSAPPLPNLDMPPS